MPLQSNLQSLPRRHARFSGGKKKHRADVRAKGEPGMLAKLGQVLKEKAKSDVDRVFKGTAKTRQQLSVIDELLTYWDINQVDEQLEELEDALLCADFGPSTAIKVVDTIRDDVISGALQTSADLRDALRESIVKTLKKSSDTAATSLQLPDAADGPAVLLIVGVNGSGKTTSIGKLAHSFTTSGASVLLGSGDTFRAAAYEQLAEWGERSGAKMASYAEGQRPAEVLCTAVSEGKEQGVDVVICDTSGRLHTNWRLMEELQDTEKEISQKRPGAPHEVLLVLDGSTGLNMMNQAREFSDMVKVSGIVLTKLDGSARGGAVVSVVDELGIPVKFVGVGEGVDDLQPFDPETFAESLFPVGDVSAREAMRTVRLT